MRTLHHASLFESQKLSVGSSGKRTNRKENASFSSKETSSNSSGRSGKGGLYSSAKRFANELWNVFQVQGKGSESFQDEFYPATMKFADDNQSVLDPGHPFFAAKSIEE